MCSQAPAIIWSSQTPRGLCVSLIVWLHTVFFQTQKLSKSPLVRLGFGVLLQSCIANEVFAAGQTEMLPSSR